MFDPPKLANLGLPAAVALVLALSAALVLIAACGSPAADAPETSSPGGPGDRPTDSTPAPTEAAKPTIPVQGEAALVGRWSDGGRFVLELGSSGVYTLSYSSRQPADTGPWSLERDGSVALEGQSYAPIPHGNLLLLEWGGKAGRVGTARILHRVGADGNLLAYEPPSSVEVPGIALEDILTITILDNWTGLSPLAPIESSFRLEPATGFFSGTAEYQLAGYTEAVSRSVPISVPLAVMEEFLALLESTPLEEGEYKPLFSHTDDFPSIAIVVEGKTGDLGFATESQGSRHIPWRVEVGRDDYVTYADTPAQALDLLDPYLARDVQEALSDLVLAREP